MDHHQVVIKVCTSLLMSLSFKSGTLKQGTIEDMQDSGPLGLALPTSGLQYKAADEQ